MKVTIIYDNTSFRKDLQHDWGFSALIEVKNRKILFDTGARGNILIANMHKLGINPKEINDVYISHLHHDHTGGLSAFLNINSKVTVWVPQALVGLNKVEKINIVKKPTKLYEGIYSTGELNGIEQSLCIQTKKGIVILVGCSHPLMPDILSTASQFGNIYGIIGGLHATRAKFLKELKLICPAHCTQYKSEIRAYYPERYVEAGAGRVIEID